MAGSCTARSGGSLNISVGRRCFVTTAIASSTTFRVSGSPVRSLISMLTASCLSLTVLEPTTPRCWSQNSA